MSPLVKLIWFSRHEQLLMGQARWWAGLKDYVLHHLTGELVTELSSASATGLLDLKSRNWDAQSLDLAGINADQLPPVLPTTTVLKLSEEAGQKIGLPGNLPVAVGAADGPLGNLGTGAIVPGLAGLSLGTSGAVRMAVPEPSFDAGWRCGSGHLRLLAGRRWRRSPGPYAVRHLCRLPVRGPGRRTATAAGRAGDPTAHRMPTPAI